MLNQNGRAVGVTGAISEATVQLVREASGRDRVQVKTTLDDDSLTIRASNITGPTERSLFSTPEDEVVRVRGEVHSAMRDQLVRTVEGQLGRRVLAYMDESSTDRDLVLYVYMLAPVGSPSMT